MNIKHVIWPEPCKHGHPIKLSINHNGSRVYLPFKINGIKQYAVIDKKVPEFDGGEFTKSKPNYISLNSAIRLELSKCEKLCTEYPTASAKTISHLMEGKKSINGSIVKSNMTLLEYIENFIKDCQAGNIKRSSGTIVNYKKTESILLKFSEVRPSDFGDINLDWYKEFIKWLRMGGGVIGKRCKTRSENTMGTYIRVLKTILNAALEDKVTTTLEHKMKYFKDYQEPSDAIYLEEDEIEKIREVDLTNYPHLELERDRFLISYSFLLRFSDTILLDRQCFSKDKKYLTMSHLKTDRRVVVPVDEFTLSLLEKYDFKLPYSGTMGANNAKANLKLKKIGELAKIDQPVRCKGIVRAKYEFITTHTARRSGATNMHKQGANEKTIMDIGGWDDVKSFRLYNKLSRLESADIAKELPFFQKKVLKVA